MLQLCIRLVINTSKSKLYSRFHQFIRFNRIYKGEIKIFDGATQVHHIIESSQVDAPNRMEPKDFCEKWIKTKQPGEWGYYKACVQEIAVATGLSPRTVESWGPDFSGRPDSVLVTLKKEDTIRQIRELVKPDDLLN